MSRNGGETEDPRAHLRGILRYAPLEELTPDELDPGPGPEDFEGRPRRDKKYESNADRQRAYRQRKAKRRSRDWAEKLKRAGFEFDLPGGRVLTSSDYGRIGNWVKAGRPPRL